MFPFQLQLVAITVINQGFSHRKFCTVFRCKRPTLAVWLRNVRSLRTLWKNEAGENAYTDGGQFNEKPLTDIMLVVQQDR